MSWPSGLVLYTLIWWTVLFAVLPFGIRPNPEPDPQTGWRGAPVRPRIGVKLLATTIIAAMLWGGCAALITSDWLSFRSGILAMPQD